MILRKSFGRTKIKIGFVDYLVHADRIYQGG